MKVTDGIVPTQTFHGALFSVIPQCAVKPTRVYRVETTSINEDSMVEISASYSPVHFRDD